MGLNGELSFKDRGVRQILCSKRRAETSRKGHQALQVEGGMGTDPWFVPSKILFSSSHKETTWEMDPK